MLGRYQGASLSLGQVSVQIYPVRRPGTGARIAFWVSAVLGFPVMALAWTWYGLAQFEAQTEQSKALSADTTMAGFAEVVGGVPLVLAHLIGLLLLVLFGWAGWRGKGVWFGILAVIIASVLGIAMAQILWAGELFELGINNDTWVP